MDDHPPLYPWEEGIRDHIHLIGLVCLRWTPVEITTQQLITALIDLHDPAMSAAVLTHIGDKTAMNIIQSLANAFIGLDPAAKDLLLKFTKTQDICRQNRNLLVHGLHAASEIRPDKHIVSKMTSHGRIRIAHYVLPTEAVLRVLGEIQALNALGQNLTTAFNRARAGQPGLLRRPKWPQPQLLTNTLQTIQPEDYMRDPEMDRGWQTKPEPVQSEPQAE